MVPCWNKIILGRSTDGGGSGLKFFKIILFLHGTSPLVATPPRSHCISTQSAETPSFHLCRSQVNKPRGAETHQRINWRQPCGYEWTRIRSKTTWKSQWLTSRTILPRRGIQATGYSERTTLLWIGLSVTTHGYCLHVAPCTVAVSLGNYQPIK